MLLNRKIPLILLLLLLQSCTESFIPKIVKYDYSVFIEALVTDDPGILPEVRISTTIPLTNSQENAIYEETGPVNNAEVFLVCDDGSEYEFDPPGQYDQESVYRLSDSDFVAETGKSYKLVIYLDGETLESDFETLIEPSPIDSLGYVVKTQKQTDDGITEQGYQFLVSNHNNNPAPSYYRWIPDATYSYFVPYTSSYKWNAFTREIVPFTSDGGRECWKNKNINGIYVSTTEGLSENLVIKAPLHFESQYGDELASLYSLHVKQLAISQASYNFWLEIRKMIYENGSLFERQPYRITGNIMCTSNPDFSVTGIFEVAGVSESRKFFAVPDEFTVLGYSCERIIVTDLNGLEDGAYIDIDERTNQIWTSPSGCFECIGRSGTSIRPAFWEDH